MADTRYISILSYLSQFGLPLGHLVAPLAILQERGQISLVTHRIRRKARYVTRMKDSP